MKQPVIHSDPDIQGGVPVFVGTRVPVENLFDYLEAGDSLDEFLKSFPSVTREQAVAALEHAKRSSLPVFDTRKKLRDRATRLKRALANEQQRLGHIDDGAGKRYLIGPLYVNAGELEKALAHYEWYEKACSDDVGEPIHYLCWALALHRTGDVARANDKLLETMVQNVYLLPTLLGSPPAVYDMWHSSNREQPEYLAEVPEEFVPELTDQERSWVKEQLDSFRFRRVKYEYVSTFRALKGETNIDKRRDILRRWDEFPKGSASSDG